MRLEKSSFDVSEEKRKGDWEALISTERNELAQLKARKESAQAIMHIQEKLDRLYRLLPVGTWNGRCPNRLSMW